MDGPPADNLVRAIDVLGTAAFAFSGALRAVDRRPDLVGMLILATVTAVGGSTLRDVVLRREPVYLRDAAYAVAIVLPAIVVFFFPRAVLRRQEAFKYFDAVGLGVFSAFTAAVTYRAGVDPLAVLLVATVVGCAGGDRAGPDHRTADARVE